MAQATLIPNVKIKDEYGVVFPTAMLLILKVDLSDSWSMEADGENEEYQEENSVGGGTYEAWYYCTPQTKALGAPIKPLRTFEDGVFSNLLIIDEEHAEIKQLLSSPTAKKDKAIAIIRKDIELRTR
jgi:hypothetical protein